ncbi:MAG: phenylacetate--CoA ligase family protein [Candidatus Binatia bacterium]
MRWWHFAKWRLLARHDGLPDFALYRQLLRQERMTRPQLDAIRLAKAQRLVEECLRNVPYFAGLLRAARITPERVRSPQDLEVLPLLDKPIIRAEKMRILNQAAPPWSYSPHTTGGSTGSPLDFYRAHEYVKLTTAANMRSFLRMSWRPGDTLVKFWAAHSPLEPPTGLVGRVRRAVRRWLEPPEILFNSYATSQHDMESWLEIMRARRPRFFYGYASNLVLFARLLAERGIRFDHVRGIASTALALFPSDRRLLQDVFPQARIIDVYGSREIPGIATECERGTMHINDDLVHVEYLPAPGDPGGYRLVVTALDNTVFPFIRYDIGDTGAPLSDPCPCGLPFSTMQWGFGKVLDSFVSPEGCIMTGGFFEDLMYGITGVHAYQFRQKTPTEILLYVVPTDTFGPAAAQHFAQVERQIHAGFSPRVHLRVESVPSIAPTPAGKHQFVVSEVRDAARTGELAPVARGAA